MHEDLIGHTFTGDDGEEWKVVGPAHWSDQYVEVERVNNPDPAAKHSVRAASLVRRHKDYILMV